MKALKKYAPFVAIGAALLALILYMFAPVMKTAFMGESAKTKVWDSLTDSEVDKVTMIVITVVAAVVALAGTVLAFFADKINFLKGKEDIVKYVVAGVLVLTAIFMFSAKGFILGDVGKETVDAMEAYGYEFKIGIGAIISGILNIVAAAAIVAPKFIKD